MILVAKVGLLMMVRFVAYCRVVCGVWVRVLGWVLRCVVVVAVGWWCGILSFSLKSFIIRMRYSFINGPGSFWMLWGWLGSSGWL